MMQTHKPKFVVFEGPEAAGKTFMCKSMVTQGLKFKEFKVVSQEDKIERHDYASKLNILDKMSTAKLDVINVIDRFVLTDIVYDKVVRNLPVDDFVKIGEKFSANNDVLVVKLVGDKIRRDFTDEKISLTRAEFNRTVEAYNVVSMPGAVTWSRRLVSNGAPSETAAALIHDDIEFAFGLTGDLVQEHYDSDLWKFFVVCICLNNTTGYRARKIVPEIFWHFSNPREMLNKPYDLMELIKPLGMQAARTQALLKFTDNFLKYDLSFDELFEDDELPRFYGVGKYGIDSHRLFIKKDFDLSNYSAPVDKELKKILDDKQGAR